MRCSRQVSPSWKNPAANGPWYQVESNPVIPVESFALTPRRSGPPRSRRRPAPRRSPRHFLRPPNARRSRRRPARHPEGGLPHPYLQVRVRETSLRRAPQEPPQRRSHNRHQCQIRHRLPGTERPKQLRAPDQERRGDHARCQPAHDPDELRHQPPPHPPGPRPRAADEHPDLDHAQQVATRPEHPPAAPLAPPPQHQPQDLVELGDPQQARHREIGDGAGGEAARRARRSGRRGRAPALRRAAFQTTQLGAGQRRRRRS